MENVQVKKVIVELDNGNTLEFDKQVVLFAEDEMSNTEKKLNNGQTTKITGVVSCSPNFLANVTESMLGTVRDNAPGLDTCIIAKHMEMMPSIAEMLAKILG